MLGRLLSRFRRPPHPPIDRRGDVWRVGDLAVCVRDDWIFTWSRVPKRGDVQRVVGVEDAVFAGNRYYWLAFDGYPTRNHFCALAFRKIVAADDQFTARVRRKRSIDRLADMVPA